jgi:uncharacterized protein with HEPN domain
MVEIRALYFDKKIPVGRVLRERHRRRADRLGWRSWRGSREHWDEDRVLRDAVLYRLLLLGEIASVLPDALRERYPDVAWRQIRAFRNLAVHKYFSVDWAVVWQISREEVPVLEKRGSEGCVPCSGDGTSTTVRSE